MLAVAPKSTQREIHRPHFRVCSNVTGDRAFRMCPYASYMMRNVTLGGAQFAQHVVNAVIEVTPGH